MDVGSGTSHITIHCLVPVVPGYRLWTLIVVVSAFVCSRACSTRHEPSIVEMDTALTAQPFNSS